MNKQFITDKYFLKKIFDFFFYYKYSDKFRFKVNKSLKFENDSAN